MKRKTKDHRKACGLHRRVRAVFLMVFFLVLSLMGPQVAVAGTVSQEPSNAPSADVGSGEDLTATTGTSDDPTGYIPSYQGHPVITGYTVYLGGALENRILERFYYSDGYFVQPAMNYDIHLATMSLCLAGSAMAASEGGTTSYTNKSVNVRELLDHIGCRDICVNNDFVKKPGEDTIGVAMGRKTININGEEFTLVPIGIRGAGYEQEWVGNMKLGSEGDAEGFRKAADRAKEAVDAYLKEYQIDPAKTKFWIAGFSRAGAVTDLLAAALTDAYDPTGTNVYGYSFATPQGAYRKARSYPNSHCTVNRCDSVPMVAPTYMGFSHYGDEYYYDDPDNPFQAYRMSISYVIDFLVSIPKGVEFTPWNGDMKTQEDFLKKYFEALQATIIPDRETFTEKQVEGNYTYEEIFSYITKFLMTTDSTHLREITESLSDFVFHISGTTLLKSGLIKDAVEEGIDNIDPEDKEDVYAILWGCFKPCFEESMTEKEITRIGSMWKAILYAVFEIAHYDYEKSGAEGFALIGTMIKNIGLLATAHTPEKYFSLIKPADDFYREETGELFAKQKPAFRVGDASDVELIVKKNNVPVASVRGGYTEASKDPSVYAGRISDKGSDLKPDAAGILYSNPDTTDERGIFFDAGGDYQVEVIALDRDDGLEFQNWVDETGVPVSSSESYDFSVTQGKSSLRVIRPVYINPSGGMTAPEEEKETGQPQNEGGSPWIWIGTGAGTAAVGGTIGAFWWRKRRRRGLRKFKKRKE